MTIADNIFIGREKTRLGIDIDGGAQNEMARALLSRLEHSNPPDMPVGDLRIGEQQIVEIAKAISQDARILILDEPTSALSATEVEILFGVIRELKAQGSPSSTSPTGSRSWCASATTSRSCATGAHHRRAADDRRGRALDRPSDDRLLVEGFRQDGPGTTTGQRSCASTT